ncbi:guanine-N(7)-methyltransferase [Clavulina sp. PMI_390]|nr:guanine-N(7)-methyltransferase [Clavulina sp. PMI_390]
MPPPPPPPSALPQLPSLASTHITSHHAYPPHSQHPHLSQNPPSTIPTLPPRKPSLPYAPRNRITPPNSVLIPITAEELHRLAESHRNPLRKSIPAVSAQLDNNPRLGAVAAPSYSIEQQNEVVVAQHYNARPEVGKAAREHSPILGLKSFNNWIKAVLIAKFARPTIHETNTSNFVGSKKRPRFIARVLDLGCGKGGDLGKWAKSDIAGYVGVDIADVSLDQARERWAGQRRKAFDAEFFAMDCYSRPLEDRLPPGALRPPFDVVSQQFCMHYAFESEEKARMMLHNTTMFLRPGGVFIGTTPNAKPSLQAKPIVPIPEGEELSFGNAVYTIRFDGRIFPMESRQPPVDAHGQFTFGHKYWFYLADAVDAPEYVVRWDAFVSLAAEYKLELIYKEDFHTIYEREQEPTEFQQLLTSMKVVDSRGKSALDQDQWDAASVYRLGSLFHAHLMITCADMRIVFLHRSTCRSVYRLRVQKVALCSRPQRVWCQCR